MKQMGVILTADALVVGSPFVATASGDPLSQAKAGPSRLTADTGTALRSLLLAARTQAKEFRSAVRPAFVYSRQAAKQNKGSEGSKGSSSSRGSDEEGSGG